MQKNLGAEDPSIAPVTSVLKITMKNLKDPMNVNLKKDMDTLGLIFKKLFIRICFSSP